MKPLTITDFQQSSSDKENEVSALVDGERVYIRTPGDIALFNRGEFYIAVALLEAMIDGRDIVLDSEQKISSLFVAHLDEIQSVYACWNHDLTKINVHAETFDERPVSATQKVGSLFSAGVDSSHTLVRHLDEIDYLIMLYGIDYGNNEETWARRLEKQGHFAASQGKTLVPVVSNAREWAEDRKISWLIFHGALLCAMGRVLGLSRLYVPSSDTYSNVAPWGSSPLLDPMWTSEDCEVIHDAAAFTRSEKTAEILSIPAIANNLQVCWYHIDHNCGECSKCIRSMLAIYMLEGSTEALPPFKNGSDLRLLKPTNPISLSFVNDLRRLAKKKGEDKVFAELTRLCCQYQRSQIFPLLDKSMLGNTFKRLYRKIRKPKWLDARVTVEGVAKNDF